MYQIKRYGVLIPSSNTTVEEELLLLLRAELKESIQFHFFRLDYETRFSVSYVDYCKQICAGVPAAIKSLNKIPGILKYGFFCTTASRFLDAQLSRQVYTPLTAINKTYSENKLSKPLIVTPYNSEITNSLLTQMPCIKDSKVINLNKLQAKELIQFSKTELLDTIVKAFDPTQYDSVLLLCTNLPSMHIAKAAKLSINRPFISSNLALLSIMLNKSIDEIITLTSSYTK